MNGREQDWRDDLTLLREFIAEHQPYPRLFVTLSGADLYGFPSADGDYDMRGAHALPLRDMVAGSLRGGGLDTIRGMTVEVLDKNRAPEMDLVSHDIGKFLRLALKGNGYVLEQLFSPLVVETSPWHEELKTIGAGLVTAKVYHHYRGFFNNQEKLYDRLGEKRVKGLLYRYRVALTGIHALRTGAIEANIVALNDWFGSERIRELIALKTSAERGVLEDDTPYLKEIASLEPQLDAAFAETDLPMQVAGETRQRVEEFLWRCRLAHAE
ncbi:MAG: nucleotidyltransferase domain-containing protein [Dehalococcoidia bacterium]